MLETEKSGKGKNYFFCLLVSSAKSVVWVSQDESGLPEKKCVNGWVNDDDQRSDLAGTAKNLGAGGGEGLWWDKHLKKIARNIS